MSTLVITPLRAEIASQLACPVAWEALCIDTELGGYMMLLWRAVAINHQVDREGTLTLSRNDLLYSDETISSALLSEDERSLEAARINISTWIAEARRTYQRLVTNLAGLTVAGRETYPKHYPRQSWSKEEIVEKSRTSDSLLFNEFSADIQTKIMWEVIGTAFASAFADPYDDELPQFRREVEEFTSANFRFFVMSCHEVGASNGEPTNCFCFEFDFPSRTAHMYPVPRTSWDTATTSFHRISAQVFLDDLPLQI